MGKLEHSISLEKLGPGLLIAFLNDKQKDTTSHRGYLISGQQNITTSDRGLAEALAFVKCKV